MGNVDLKWSVCIVVYFCVLCIEGASVTDGNGTKPSELNGKKLREIGMNLNLPKLRMIGKAIEIVEEKIESGMEKLQNETARKMCNLNPCLPWTEWSKCSTNIHLFGSKFRTRQCSLDLITCKIDHSKTEKEFGICGGLCPDSYNNTKSGLCLKLYSDNKRTNEEAELQCQKDGGHLVNIDSKIKSEDVWSLTHGTRLHFWIDGRRKDVNSHWTYTYGPQEGFFKWHSSYPKNSSSALCLRLYPYNSGLLWFDENCNNNHYSVCEVTAIF